MTEFRSGDLAAAARLLAWRRSLAVLAMVLLWLGFCYRDTALAMAAIWARSETFTHCFLLPPIVLWMIWRKRSQLAQLAPAPNPWMLIPMALAGLAWLAGQMGAVNVITQFAFVTLVVLAVPAILGLRVAAAIAFPLGFLFFTVPFGEFVMPRMMEWTADFTVLALRASGVPVYREGLQFVIPSGNWSVVEACSGVRYLIASITVGTLFAYLNYRTLSRRLVFIGISIAVPVVANWLRAYMIVMMGHLSSNKLAVGADHLIYGWVFFGVVIMIMFAIGARWSEDMTSETAPRPLSAMPMPLATRSAPLALAAVLAALFAAVPPLAGWAIVRGEAASAVKLVIPAQAGGWRQASAPLLDWRPTFENPAAEAMVSFGRDAQSAGLYLAFYRNQRYDSKLISSANVLVKSNDRVWAQVGGGAREIRVAGEPLRVRTAELLDGRVNPVADAGRWVVWQWYWVDGRLTDSDAWAKALTVWSRLRGHGDDSAVVILYAPKGGGDAALDAFARDAGPAIEATLRSAREGR